MKKISLNKAKLRKDMEKRIGVKPFSGHPTDLGLLNKLMIGDFAAKMLHAELMTWLTCCDIDPKIVRRAHHLTLVRAYTLQPYLHMMLRTMPRPIAPKANG